MILLDKENKIFTLHTQNTTYQMKADRHNVLVHTYYGPRVSGGDLSYLVRYADRACAPTPLARIYTFTLGSVPEGRTITERRGHDRDGRLLRRQGHDPVRRPAGPL